MASTMQIEHESSLESFDERRVNQLKAQLVQLERQAIMLTKAVTGYKQKLHSAEGAIQQTLNLLMSYNNGNISRGSITLNCSDIASQIKVLKDALERVSASSSQTETTPWVAQAYTPNTTFLKTDQQATLAEISNASLKHLNLAHVTKLEQRLCILYGDLSAHLLKLQQSDSSMTGGNAVGLKLLKSLEKACEDLQQLSFIVPSVPWSKRQCLAEVSVDDVMKALPKLTYARSQDVKDLLAAVLKLSEHRYNLMLNRCKSLELELNHIRITESKASVHVETTSTELLSGLSNYHQGIKETLITPLDGVLEKYNALSSSPTDENLKLFLQQFKDSAPHLQQVCASISAHEITGDALKTNDLGYTKNLKKALKSLNLEKMALEDRENELLQSERESRDEVKERVGKLSTPSANIKVKPFSMSQTETDVGKSPKRPQTSSPAAATFLSKLEKAERVVQMSQSKSHLSTAHTKADSSKQPVWLQEMKEDLSVKSSSNSVTVTAKRTVRK